METAPFLSIIIPVYNVSKYICECLDSIIMQDITDVIEIILIDDGSTDDSAKICDNYVKKDTRISVIHKKNEGAAAARNVGIKVSSGKYLLFIDSDDYIINGSLNNIIKYTKTDGDCDVVFLNANSIYPNGTIKEWSYRYSKECIFQQNRKDVLMYLLNLSRIPVSPCIKLLNRKFIYKNNLFFTKGIACEDVDHTYKVLCAARSFNYYDFPYYYARFHREGSSMNNEEYAFKRFYSTFFIINKWISLAKKNPSWKDIIYGFLAIQYMYLAAMYHDIKASEKEKYRIEVLRLSWILKYGANWKFAFIRIFYKIFQLQIFSLLLRKILL